MPPTTHKLMRRAELIIDELWNNEYISVEALSKKLSVSTATLRKDLARLEEQGLLRRVHGGAVTVEPLLFERFRRKQDFRENERAQVEEKRRIAMAAAHRINDNEVIALTGGTTATQVARSIRPGRKVTVITNALNIAMELSNREYINVFVPGGFLRGSMFSLTGINGIQSIGEFVIDKVFIGVNGVHIDHGLTTMDVEHAAMHRAMIQQSREKICIADHTKIGQIHSALVCPIDDMTCLITSREASPEIVDKLRVHKIEVVLT